MRFIIFRLPRKFVMWLQQSFSLLKERKDIPSELKEQKKLTIHERPLYADDVNTWSDELKQDPRFAIVIQGPIIKENDFTLNSIRIYKKHFRNTPIIVSTWDDEKIDHLQRLRDEGVDVLESRKPDYPGQGNINYQIVSSFAGIRRASTLGAEYVLKTRTDQRMYAPNIAEFLCNLLEVFPVAQGYQQHKRIIGVSLNTFKYRLYGLSDMFIFGHIKDMETFWSCPLDNRRFDEPTRYEKGRTLLSHAKWCVCEVYLTTNFLNTIGHEVQWTLKDSWNAFANHFIVVNKQDLDMLWLKYGHQEYRWLHYDSINGSQEMTFREWFNLYAGLPNKVCIDDKELGVSFSIPLMTQGSIKQKS